VLPLHDPFHSLALHSSGSRHPTVRSSARSARGSLFLSRCSAPIAAPKSRPSVATNRLARRKQIFRAGLRQGSYHPSVPSPPAKRLRVGAVVVCVAIDFVHSFRNSSAVVIDNRP
jgi:hypothetical protein